MDYFNSLLNNKIKVNIALIIFPLCIYFKSIFYDFSPLDDQWMIVKNSDILADWSNIKVFFTKPLAGLYYRPLFSISLMFDFHIGKTNPLIYHLTNLVFHLLSVILLYKVLLLLKTPQKTSFLLALLFSIHPAITHAIAWIPGRNDLLLSVFALSSIIYLIKFCTEPKNKYLLLHTFFFFCAMLTKENAFMLSLFYITLIYHFNVKPKTYLSFFTLWQFIFIMWYFLRTIAVKSTLPNGTNFLISIKNFGMGFLLYIGKTIIPAQLSVFPTLKNSTIIFGIISFVILAFVSIKFKFKNNALALSGLILFFGMLSISVWYGAVNSTGEHYEQRLYLPLAGLLLFISQINYNYNSKFLTYFIGFIIFIFATTSFLRLNIYKTEKSFTEAGIKEAPEYYLFYSIKADKLLEEQKYEESLPYYNKVIALQPLRAQIYSSRGYAYVELGRLKEAVDDFSAAIKYSNNPDMYLNRCLTYNKLGDINKALEDLTYLKNKSPQTIPAGLEQELMDKWYTMAESNISNQIKQQPNNAQLYVSRAKILFYLHKSDESLKDLKRACELEPNNQTFKNYLNDLIFSMNR